MLVVLTTLAALASEEVWTTPVHDRPPTTLAAGFTWRSSFGPTSLHAPELYIGSGFRRSGNISGGISLRTGFNHVHIPGEGRGWSEFGTAELNGMVVIHGAQRRVDHGIGMIMGFGAPMAYWFRQRDTSMSFGLRYSGYYRAHPKLHVAAQFEVAGTPFNWPDGYVDVAGGVALIALPLPTVSVQLGVQGGIQSLELASLGVAGRVVDHVELGVRWYVPLAANTTYVRPALEVKGYWDLPKPR